MSIALPVHLTTHSLELGIICGIARRQFLLNHYDDLYYLMRMLSCCQWALAQMALPLSCKSKVDGEAVGLRHIGRVTSR